MPSSHSAISLGWFLLCLLDASERHVGSSLLRPSFDRHSGWNSVVLRVTTEHRKILHFMRLLLTMPFIEKDDLTPDEFIAYITAYFLMLVPVPFMRVVLNDHTTQQVTVGVVFGMLTAALWWRIVRMLQKESRHLEGESFCYGMLYHDFCLPQTLRFPTAQVELQAARTNQESESGQVELASTAADKA